MTAGPLSAEPLVSWRPGATRDAILEFVNQVTTPGSSSYVPPGERIAVIEHDGVLIPEIPRVQGVFTLQRLRTQRDRHPEWETLMPFRGALEIGERFFREVDPETALVVMAATHSGLTQSAFRREVQSFWRTARHPAHGVAWSRTAYLPMQELLDLLRSQGFRIFIVTAGSADFVRAISQDMYGIPPERVIGSQVETGLVEEDGQLELRRIPGDVLLVDGAQKVLAIDSQIGQRPLVAVGRARHGGDIEMLRYSERLGRPSLQLLIIHDDFERDFALFDEDPESLAAAARGGWRVVSMRWEWRRLFAFEPLPEALQ
ncbi:MAG: haloacid dehalogenase-like hydrolase [Chromatiales bacterium]|nr:haloacid dehalogenase-like hydrolase [Chromatiales bacterium]